MFLGWNGEQLQDLLIIRVTGQAETKEAESPYTREREDVPSEIPLEMKVSEEGGTRRGATYDFVDMCFKFVRVNSAVFFKQFLNSRSKSLRAGTYVPFVFLRSKRVCFRELEIFSGWHICN